MVMAPAYRGRQLDISLSDAFHSVGVVHGVRRQGPQFVDDCLTVHYEWLARVALDPTLGEKVAVLVHVLKSISPFTAEGRFEALFDMLETRFEVKMTEMFEDVPWCGLELLRRYIGRHQLP